MPRLVLTSARLFAGGVDLTSATSTIDLTSEIDEQDITTFKPEGHVDAGWKEVRGGIGSSTLDAEGMWDAGDPAQVDDALWARLGGVGPWTACPDGAAVGARAYAVQALTASYSLLGEVGAAAPWKASAVGASAVAAGQVAHPPGTPRTAAGVGTALNLGPVAAGRQLTAAVHVVSATGTLAITPRIETDDASGFASPTTAVTGSAFTAATPGAQLLTAAGPITDTWQRIAWAATGTGSVLFLAVLAIT